MQGMGKRDLGNLIHKCDKLTNYILEPNLSADFGMVKNGWLQGYEWLAMQQCKVQSSLIKFLGPFPMLLQNCGEFSIHRQYLPQHVFNFALSVSVTCPLQLQTQHVEETSLQLKALWSKFKHCVQLLPRSVYLYLAVTGDIISTDHQKLHFLFIGIARTAFHHQRWIGHILTGMCECTCP